MAEGALDLMRFRVIFGRRTACDLLEGLEHGGGSVGLQDNDVEVMYGIWKLSHFRRMGASLHIMH